MRHRYVLRVLLTIVALTMTMARAYALSKDDVLQALQKREDYFRTGVFKWKKTKVILKGTFGNKEDAQHEHREEFLFSKNMFKFKSTGPMFLMEPNGGSFIPTSSTVSYDGNRIKRFDDSGKPYEAAASNEKYDSFTCFWMTWNFRPCSCEGGFASSQWRLTPFQSVIAGENHFALEEQHKDIRTTCWINEKYFTIGRVTRTFREHLVYQMDIKYKKIEPHGFLPIEWKNSSWSPEGGTSIIDTSVSEVTDWKINEPITDQELSFEFPRGVRVSDDRFPKQQGDTVGKGTRRLGWWTLAAPGVVVLLVLWRFFRRWRVVTS